MPLLPTTHSSISVVSASGRELEIEVHDRLARTSAQKTNAFLETLDASPRTVRNKV